VSLDQVDDACLDVGPDGVVIQIRHVRDWDLYRQIECLGRRRRDDRGLRLPRQESRDFFGRPDGRRQPDTLSGRGQQLVEPFQ